MKERPILFSAPMVRAILDGSKTQTRRVVKMKPHHTIEERDNGTQWTWMYDCNRDADYWLPCPYGQSGDRLWVRESWRVGAWDESRPAFAFDYCDGPQKEWVNVPDSAGDEGELFNRLWQQSTDDAIKAFGQQERYKWEPGESPCRWRPSIHMPRWASRITLEITGVRVERLQDISIRDAIAEGVNVHADHHCKPRNSRYSPVQAFRDLWESINGDDSWEANPWVWVVKFKPIARAAIAKATGVKE